MDTIALPTCQHCGHPLRLVTVIAEFGDRPQVRVFNCEICSRLAMFFLENGLLRKW